ncbi:MAG: hypothetical protein L0170_19305 [Acidobacteria bacterium]|nr:hypothetical protein [Acidobacteriota bacterium]
MESFERLEVFYLGRVLDPEGYPDGKELLLCDSKDLTTRAICVGMTGSGKSDPRESLSGDSRPALEIGRG